MKQQKKKKISAFQNVPNPNNNLNDKELQGKPQFGSLLFSQSQLQIFDLKTTNNILENKKFNHSKNDQGEFKNILQKKFCLRQIMEKKKKNKIVKNFKNKINRNITKGKPVEIEYFQRQGNNEYILKESIFSQQGLNLNSLFEIPYSILTIAVITLLCYFTSLGFVFEDSPRLRIVEVTKYLGAFFFFLQMMVCMSTKKIVKGKKIVQLKQIFVEYVFSKFIIDFSCFILVLVDIFHTQNKILRFLRIIYLFKISQLIKKLKKIQTFIPYNFERQIYISLAKIFILNFLFSHFLSIIMMQMTNFEEEENWLEKAGLNDLHWSQQYAWAFYWATTTMLTVGFGDISPANFKQALCLSAIQTISCILLAYTINCVGSLISSLREQDIEKQNSITTIRRLTEEKQISQDLERKVCHYIEQRDKVKKKFQLDNDKNFIASLPKELKSEYFNQSNKKIFKNLLFFGHLADRTLRCLGQKINIIIAHPEQIIFKPRGIEKVQILQEGKIGFYTNNSKKSFDEALFDQITVNKKQKSRLIQLVFFSREVNPKFNIKSIQYSIIYELPIEEVKQILKLSQNDYETFCQIRDQSKHVIDEFETIKCQFCQKYHSKIKCPKLHFTPIQQVVIFKYLRKNNVQKNRRKKIERINYLMKYFSALRLKKQMNSLEKLIFGKNQNKKTKISNPNTKKRIKRSSEFFTASNKFTENIKTNADESTINLISSRLQEKIQKMFKTNEQKQFIVDEIHNFTFYFNKYNASNLQTNYFSAKNCTKKVIHTFAEIKQKSFQQSVNQNSLLSILRTKSLQNKDKDSQLKNKSFEKKQQNIIIQKSSHKNVKQQKRKQTHKKSAFSEFFDETNE